jgi:hypothetical protein
MVMARLRMCWASQIRANGDRGHGHPHSGGARRRSLTKSWISDQPAHVRKGSLPETCGQFSCTASSICAGCPASIRKAGSAARQPWYLGGRERPAGIEAPPERAGANPWPEIALGSKLLGDLGAGKAEAIIVGGLSGLSLASRRAFVLCRDHAERGADIVLAPHVVHAERDEVGREGNDGLSVTHTNAVQTHTRRRARGA